MLARGRERRIEQRRNSQLEIWGDGKFAVLGSVEGPFEIIDFRTDVNAAGKRLAETVGTDRAGKRRKRGQFTQREINFGDRAVGANVADATERKWDRAATDPSA